LKLPRVVIAGEHKSRFVPPSILLIAAMKRCGIPMRIFYCGYNPVDVCLLQSIAEERITVINLKTCTNPKIIKALFETGAKHDMINVIICDLGERGETIRECYIDTTASDIASTLDCSIILCCYSENHPRPAIKILGDICTTLESKNPNIRIDGAIFINPFDPHSFQLFENSVGISFKWSTFGYIPSELEPPIPTIEALSTANKYSRGTFSIRAATARITQLQGQIDYLTIEAIGKYNQDWTPTGKVARIQKSILPKVAIFDNLALTREGNNAELLFNSLGCQVHYISAEEIISKNFDMYYFPDGLGYIAINSFFLEEHFSTLLKNAVEIGKIIFANGASGLIFGEKFINPDNSETKGLGVLPVKGNYNSSLVEIPEPVVCTCTKTDCLLLQGDEKVNAYMLPNVVLESQSKSLRCSFAATGSFAGNIGYEKNKTIITGVCIDLWSNVDVIRRLLCTI
jgi:cobyrinic acid a,c-diamide synthase